MISAARAATGDRVSDIVHPWLRLTIEEAPDAIVLVDRSGTVRQINPAFEALSGWAARDLVGQPLSTVIEPAGDGSAAPRWANPERSGRLSGQPRPCRHRNGSLFWVETFTLTLRRPDDGIQGCLHVLSNLSDQIHGADAWAAARRGPLEPSTGPRGCDEHFRGLYEKIPAILHSIDAAGRLVIVSDAWLSMMGYRRGEVIGRLSTDFLTPESRRYALDVVLPAFRATGRCHGIAYQLVTKTGEIRDVELSAASEFDDDGTFIRSLAVLLDVTERKKIERMLIAQTAALQRSNEDLKRIAKIAAHDLQEPLRRVITYSDVLKEDFGAELSEDAARIAGIIQSGGRRLRLMINGLHDYVAVRDQLDQGFEPVDLSAVVCHALDDLKDAIASKGVRIELEHLPLVWGRAPVLQMVFHHLLSNAIRHGCAHGQEIAVSAADAGRFWQLAVTDQGRGIEPRFADRIFRIFQRLQHGDEEEGSGAGLAICRLIVQRCGGDIWLDRAYCGGARFVFTLPKERPDVPGQAPPGRTAPA
jgi:PAS domain S-box-containing protein